MACEMIYSGPQHGPEITAGLHHVIKNTSVSSCDVLHLKPNLDDIMFIEEKRQFSETLLVLTISHFQP